MKGIELLKILQRINKPFYTISDLEKVTGLSRNSLYVALKRWLAAGFVERVGQGIYLYMGSTTALENIAAQLYLPNYVSFESALSKHGILNLVPYSITFATTRKTRKYTLRKQQVEFRQIATDLFWGYEMKGGIYVAIPEKAFLDEVYFVVRGKANLDYGEIDLRKMSIKTLRGYSKRFPANVQVYVKKLLSS